MKSVIHKQVLKIAPRQEVLLPESSMIIAAKEQHGDLCIWYRCFLNQSMQSRTFMVALTGHELDDVPVEEHQIYIDTVLMDGGKFVVHVFEILPSGLTTLDTLEAGGHA